MKYKQILLIAFLLALFFNWTVEASEITKKEIPEDIYQKAISFAEVFLKAKPEEAYALFGENIKKEVELGQLATLMSKLGDIAKGYQTLDFQKAEYRTDEGGFYILLFHIATDGPKIEYIVSLKKKENEIFVQGFNFKTIPLNPPSDAFILKNARPIHYIVLICFVICIAIQIWCLIFFIRKKDLKRKWLYIISSFIGFPIGFGIRWVTGTFALNFGFKIPAVAISWPLRAPEMWSISVFFPVGLVVMLIVKAKDIDQYTPVTEPTGIKHGNT